MEDCCPGCSCDSSVSSRRDVLAALSVAALAIPALASTAHAEAATAPSEGAGTWVKTVKATDLPEHGSKNITQPLMVITRDGVTIRAFSAKCTHKGCTVTTPAGKTTLNCPCHRAEFDYAGKNLQGPHKPGATAKPSLPPLNAYAIRLNNDGIIEVDTSRTRTTDDDSTKITLPT